MDVQEINTLIQSQESDSLEIKRLFNNLRKDSSSRKTGSYLQERRLLFKNIFSRARNNNDILKTKQDILSSHDYIKTNYFEKNIKQIYDAAMEQIDKDEKKLQEVHDIFHPSTSFKTYDSSKYKIQRFRMNQLKNKINQVQTAIEENKPNWFLQSNLQSLQNQWQQIESMHEELLISESSLDHEYFANNVYETIQGQYETSVELIQGKIHSTLTSTSSRSGKLPQIKIPIFSGKYDSWGIFKDLFTKIIHEDNMISSCEKMQYLKSHVQGDAAKIIQYLPISEVNYVTAWNLLTERYDDKRRISMELLDKLLDLPNIKKSNTKNLQELYDSINECLELLKQHGNEVVLWNLILCRLLSRKWDDETNTKYEEQLDNSNEIQDFKQMMLFLEKRFKSLEKSDFSSTSVYKTSFINENSTSFNNNNQVTNRNLNFDLTQYNEPKRKYCWYCDIDGHTINYCSRFITMNAIQRNNVVHNRNMCRRCLNHIASKQCVTEKFKNCETCQRPDHNTLLHVDKPTKQLFEPKDKISCTNMHTENLTTNVMSNITSNVSGTLKHTNNTVLLATAMVQTTSYDGMPHLLRVLCDQGSESSFCTEEVAQLLAYPKKKICADIKGIGDEEPKQSSYSIDITLRPRLSSDYKLPVSLIVLPKLTSSLPSNDVQQIQSLWLKNKVIADPTYYKKGPIDIILGAQEYSKILLKGFEKLEDGILAQDTEFGWILSGFCSSNKNNGIKVLSCTTRTEEVKHLTKFLEPEEIPQKITLNNDDTNNKQTVISNNLARICHHKCNSKLKTFNIMFTLLLIFQLFFTMIAAETYNIEEIDPGFYIEYIGNKLLNVSLLYPLLKTYDFTTKLRRKMKIGDRRLHDKT
ncbi:uncharacterized protein LOC125049565 [Pieris napi]|uniref:uncharacterized protein LOC125049565 n=1 Tax=Pieris napi TaxID=78633 RepID=UPI001FB9FF43|nr:uncharacterized protein LOC125049565 [Pieris napi]